MDNFTLTLSSIIWKYNILGSNIYKTTIPNFMQTCHLESGVSCSETSSVASNRSVRFSSLSWNVRKATTDITSHFCLRTYRQQRKCDCQDIKEHSLLNVTNIHVKLRGTLKPANNILRTPLNIINKIKPSWAIEYSLHILMLLPPSHEQADLHTTTDVLRSRDFWYW
jgi:hypothetical protein